MAISEDLRSVQATLMQGLNLDNAPLLRLVCNNLQSIAEQIESLENLPLATRDIAGKVIVPYSGYVFFSLSVSSLKLPSKIFCFPLYS